VNGEALIRSIFSMQIEARLSTAAKWYRLNTQD
jgi:hypothetical protein